MKWQEIQEVLKELTVNQQGDSSGEVQQLVTDSRLLRHAESSLFFAISGNQHDGHDYIRSLSEKGVSYFVGERQINIENSGFHYLQVRSTPEALQKIAQFHRQKFDIPVVGITGSNGKTTVKEWLSIILGKKYRVVKSPKSYNSQIGVPHSVWQINKNHEAAIVETGISKKGEMAKLFEIVTPTIGIFTTIGPAHDEGFRDRAEKIREKSLLFQSCGKIVFCEDHHDIRDHLRETYPDQGVSWSTTDLGADLYFYPFRKGYAIDFEGDRYYFRLPFSFDIWLENVFHVITVSLLMGCEPYQIQEGLYELEPIPMRLEVKEGINSSFLIDDTYNNDLQGLTVALDFLKQQQQKSKKTLILSDLLQTGISHSHLYREVDELLSQHNITRLIAIGPDLRDRKDQFSLPVTAYPTTSDFLSHPPSFGHEMILIKGARKFELEKVVSYLEIKNHRTILEVNFESIVHNLNTFRSYLKPDTKLMVMVKAFAYGGGSLEIANLLQFHQVDYLGVAYTDEAVALRKNGVTLPLMVMNPEFGEASLLSEYNLEPEVYNLMGLKRLVKLEDPPAVHLKIETGMNRLGFTDEQLPELLRFLKDNNLRVAGIFTHFSSADDPSEDDYTRNQGQLFEKQIKKILDVLGYRPLIHAVNTAGIIRWEKYHYDMVRLGIGLYGHDSSGTIDLRPISTLRSKISQVKEVKKGGTIGYGRAGKADEDKRIAIVPIGYADGYLRLFSQGKGKMLVNGKLVPTIGNVCMDMTMLDISNVFAEEGDEVTIFGEDPTIRDLAEWAGTIPYEILTNISHRVKRIYLSE